MKVAQAVSTALLGAVALSGATAAFAIQDPGTQPTDLIIAVWNPSTNTSWVQDLGTPNADLSNGTFTNPAGFSTSYQVDTSGTQLASNLGAGTYVYSVFSVDYSCGTCGTFAGNTEYFSLTGGQTPPPQINNGSVINNGENSVATYINAFIGTAASTHLSGSNTSDYWAFGTGNPGIGGGDFTINGWGGGANAGSTLELVKLVGGGTPGGADDVAGTNAIESILGNSATNFGLFSFNQATGVLSYNLTAGTPVPLPAAGWLLVSGLLALGAVARRRNGIASAAIAS